MMWGYGGGWGWGVWFLMFVLMLLFVRGRFPLRSFGHQKYAPLAVIPDST